MIAAQFQFAGSSYPKAVQPVRGLFSDYRLPRRGLLLDGTLMKGVKALLSMCTRGVSRLVELSSGLHLQQFVKSNSLPFARSLSARRLRRQAALGHQWPYCY